MSAKLSAEQLRILKALDVDAALKNVAHQGFIPSNKEIALAGLHKTRLQTKSFFTDSELAASREWLREHHYEVPGD